MRIGIVSDTHRMENFMNKAIPHLKECDLIIHAGDNFSDSKYIHKMTNTDIIAVKGNCDFEDVEDEIAFEVEGKTIFKADYTVNKGKNSQKLNGTITIIADETNIPINFNIESNKELNKINLKTTLPIDNTMLISRASFGNDATFEIDSQTTGELGKGTNSNTSVISITSGDTTIKVNLKEDITFSDDVSIDDLNTNNGKCLNNMSVSEMEALIKEIIVNYQKVLPIKLQLLGVNTSTSNDNSLVVDTTNEDSNNSINETLVNTTTEDSVLSTQED